MLLPAWSLLGFRRELLRTCFRDLVESSYFRWCLLGAALVPIKTCFWASSSYLLVAAVRLVPSFFDDTCRSVVVQNLLLACPKLDTLLVRWPGQSDRRPHCLLGRCLDSVRTCFVLAFVTWSSRRVVVLLLVPAWYLLWFRSLVTGLVLVIVSLIDLAPVLLLAVELVLLSRRVVVVASPVLVVVSLLLLVIAPTCFHQVDQ